MSARQTALVVDTGAALDSDITGGRAEVSLHVEAGAEILDGAAASEIYRRLRRGEEAHTSTPSPGDYLAAYDALFAAGYRDIVCLTIPAGWSGMHNAATLAAGMFASTHGDARVDVIEAPTAAAGIGLLARIADAVCRAGAAPQAVRDRIAQASEEVRMYGALATLEYVARSGRVPTLIAGVSDALKVRPIFELRSSGTGRVGLARTHSGVLRTLEKVAQDSFDPTLPLWVLTFHADAADTAAELSERLEAVCRVVRSEVVALSPVIGVHTGPGVVGFAALPLHDGDPVLAG
ncbi:MAG: DegV family protein [Candidatus Dormibacteria bacterium]